MVADGSPIDGDGAGAPTAAPWRPTLVRWPGGYGEPNSRGFAPTGAARAGELN
jgi:hypothetical protein